MPSRYLNLIAISIALFVAYLPVSAGPLVEKGAKLELISNDFQLADGPSWNGSRLLIPDVKGETIYQFDPKSGSMETLVPQAAIKPATTTTAACICLKMPMVAFPGLIAASKSTLLLARILGLIPEPVPTTSSPTIRAASTTPSQDPDKSSISTQMGIRALP